MIALSLVLACLPIFQHAGGRAGVPRQEESLSLQLYDVLDLARLAPLADGASAEEIAARAESEEASFAHLVDFLAAHMEPSMTGSAQALQVARGGTIVANATARQHAYIQKFIELQREYRADLFDVQLKLIELEDGALPLVETDAVAVFLTEIEVERVLEAATRAPGGILSAPRLLVVPRRSAEISAVEEIAYVKDYELRHNVLPGNQTIADPTIGVVEDGLRFSVRVTPIDGGHLTLELDMKLMRVTRPITSYTTALGDHGPEVTICLPEVATNTLRTTLVMPNGGTAFLTTTKAGPRPTHVLVRVRRVSPESQPSSDSATSRLTERRALR